MISLRAVSKIFSDRGQATPVLKGIDLRVRHAEALCLVGPSGSGKSTLLNIIGTLTRPTEGTYCLDGRETTSLGDIALAEIRRRYFGFIFQKFNLIWEATAQQNVELPMQYAGVSKSHRRGKAATALEAVGLGLRKDYKAFKLSGGEQQRVAIARALVNAPRMILADEPTGNLDTAASEIVIGMLLDYWRSGKGLILITHNPAIARRFPRTLEVRDGRIDDRKAEGSIAGSAAGGE